MSQDSTGKSRDEVAELKEKLKEVQSSLEGKDTVNRELTEFMNTQAERIEDLTREGIKTIENYEQKIEEKE